LAIVVARRSWLEMSLWTIRKGRKKEKEHTKKRKRAYKKEEKMVSEQPSSTAEIR